MSPPLPDLELVQVPLLPVAILVNGCGLLFVNIVEEELVFGLGLRLLLLLLLLMCEPNNTFLPLFFRIFRCFFNELVGVLFDIMLAPLVALFPICLPLLD